MGFIIYYLVLIVNPMGRILVRWKHFWNNLEMLCHPICNWLYCINVAANCTKRKVIGLFCKRALQKRLYSAKETYHLKEPTNRSHRIVAQKGSLFWHMNVWRRAAYSDVEMEVRMTGTMLRGMSEIELAYSFGMRSSQMELRILK